MTQRRVTIIAPDGRVLFPGATREMLRGNPHPELDTAAIIDVSDIPNADATAPMQVTVEEQCDHGTWHEIGRVPLPNWADDAWRQER